MKRRHIHDALANIRILHAKMKKITNYYKNAASSHHHSRRCTDSPNTLVTRGKQLPLSSRALARIAYFLCLIYPNVMQILSCSNEKSLEKTHAHRCLVCRTRGTAASGGVESASSVHRGS